MKLSERNPPIGTVRVAKWFAWWPVDIYGEERWLETVYVTQKFQRGPFGYFWLNMNFVTEEIYNDRSENREED